MGGIQMEVNNAETAGAMKRLLAELLLLYQNLPKSRSTLDNNGKGSFLSFAETVNNKK